jgi:L-fuculose-phosphate aldolase
MSHEQPRAALADAARALRDRGLGQGTAGNLSARVPEGMLITPSAVPYDRLRPDDLVLMDLGGDVLESVGLAPSTEWRLHAALLSARPEVGAVLHAHPMFCTTLACLRRDIPPFHYMVAVAGGDSIRCAPYATFGTPELAHLAVTALEDRRACLLANHGMVALAASPAAALALAVEVETLAAQYWRTLQAGQPTLLSADEMADVLARFETYGR